jgi:hypothetical protein
MDMAKEEEAEEVEVEVGRSRKVWRRCGSHT